MFFKNLSLKDFFSIKIIAINEAKIIQEPKNRPINNENDRKNTLMSFAKVDEVLIFNEISPTKIINKIKPNVIIRGDDFNEKQVRQRDKINKNIDIKIFKKKPGYSTTKIISSAKRNK